MKKLYLTLCVAFASVAMCAAGLEGVRIYVNPGHGSFGPDDRPMATIPYPKLATTGMPDTTGFYESNTNLWKSLELSRKLRAAGAIVTDSRTQSGPWPYTYPYSEYSWAKYQQLPDFQKYNRNLTEIREEVEVGNYDYFISIHSNAANSDGQSANYPVLLFRGKDDNTYMAGDSRHRAEVLWPYLFEAMHSGIDPITAYSKTNPNVRGDINFMGKENVVVNNGTTYHGYYQVLLHSVPGYLAEGYFHTYQPARHRALNPDYCRQEGVRYYRGIAAYYNHEPEKVGYIMGTVKDLHERIIHPLFTYNPKTNDQWKPLNGAVVTLYKAGVKVADYTVDNNYNGIFVFSDLEPGNDYTLEVACTGYKPLFDEYKAPITVKANETTYPMLFLEAENYVEPTDVYKDYPDPVQPEGTTLPATFNMTQQVEATYAIEGTIKRTLYAGDSTIVLSHTEDGTAHLYLINHLTKSISSLSTNGIIAPDASNKGDYLGLSDIAYTCDGKLIGCNYIRCQYEAQYVDAGYKRGTMRFYKWDSLSSNPTLWASTLHSGNWFRGDGGYSLTVAGPSEDCTICLTYTTGGASQAMRFSTINIVNNSIISELFTMKDVSAASPFTLGKIGTKHMLQSSPRNLFDSWVVDGDKTTPIEWTVMGSNVDNKIEGTMAADAYGKSLSVINFFKYAGKILSVAPYEVDGKVAGVRLYDITDGLDKATLVKTTNTDLATPVAANYAAATAKVTGVDLTIYLVVDGTVTIFTTKASDPTGIENAAVEQLQVRKVIENGQLLIIRDGVYYNVMGVRLN